MLSDTICRTILEPPPPTPPDRELLVASRHARKLQVHYISASDQQNKKDRGQQQDGILAIEIPSNKAAQRLHNHAPSLVSPRIFFRQVRRDGLKLSARLRFRHSILEPGHNLHIVIRTIGFFLLRKRERRPEQARNWKADLLPITPITE